LSRRARVALDVAGYGVGGLLAALALIRGGKAVHPHGVVYRTRLVISGAPGAPQGSELLSTPATHSAILRFSRSLGLPRPLPDLLGTSLRVIDAYGADRHQDVLAVSSIDLPVLHHVFVPAGDLQQRPYSSSLPYRAGDDTFILGITPDPRSPRPDGRDEFERLDRAASTGRLVFGLAAAPLGGRFRRLGSLHIEDRLPHALDALRFDPFNCGGGLRPVGTLNRLRDYAYPLSQTAWARRHGGTIAQGRADAQLELVRGADESPRGLRADA
jgi:hypothetical protein